MDAELGGGTEPYGNMGVSGGVLDPTVTAAISSERRYGIWLVPCNLNSDYSDQKAGNPCWAQESRLSQGGN